MADARFASEGHGAYRGKLDEGWDGIFASRVMGPMLGRTPAPERPAGEVEWFRVDSACRQHVWGEWTGGLYTDEKSTPQPAPNPLAWPLRTAIQEACPVLMPPPPPIV